MGLVSADRNALPDLFGQFGEHGRTQEFLDEAVGNAKKGPLDTLNFQGADLTNPLSEQNHLPGQNYFDQGVKGDGGLLDRQAQRGTSFYKGLLNHGAEDTQLGEGDSSDPMSHALASRYESKYDNAAGQIKAKNKLQAEVEKSAGDATTANEYQQVYSNEQQNYAEQYAFEKQRESLHKQWLQQQQQAQAALTGAILGGFGAVFGTALGGPVGGAIGAKAGQAGGAAAA